MDYQELVSVAVAAAGLAVRARMLGEEEAAWNLIEASDKMALAATELRKVEEVIDEGIQEELEQ